MLRRFLPLFLLCVLMLPARAQPNGQSPEREFARAEAAWDKEDFAAAESHFTSALNLSVGDSGDSNDEAHAYFGRGLARLQQEKWVGAREDLTRSIAIEPRNADSVGFRDFGLHFAGGWRRADGARFRARDTRRTRGERQNLRLAMICEYPKNKLARATLALDVRWKMRKVNPMNPKMFSKPVKWLLEGALAIAASGAIFFLS